MVCGNKNTEMNRNNTILTCILISFLFIFALFIRLYKVDSAPSGVLVDEASIGYNAYSILKTGKDEYGISLPLVFKAFGDQKLPLYPYLVVPAIKYLGLSIFAVRMPSVLAGSILPIVIFFLLSEFRLRKRICFFGGIITAVSPWMIILSRFGYESNIGLLCFSMGLLFSLISLRKKNVFIPIVSGVFFGLTLYSYVAYRFITPIMMLSFLFIKTRNSIKTKFILFASFLIVVLPLFGVLFNPQSTVRFNQTNFSYVSGLKMEIDENRTYCSQLVPKMLCYIVSNKATFMARSYLYRYIDTFSPHYLFLTGDNKDLSLNVDNFGLFYVWLLPFYLLGIFVLLNRICNKRPNATDILVFIGLFISVIPSLLVGNPHKLRLSALFPFIIIVMMYGVNLLERYLKNKIAKSIVYITLNIAAVLSVCFFLVLFLTVHVQKYEISYRTYVPKLMKYLGENTTDSQIYIRSITEGIIYYAFINKVDPLFYQKNILKKPPDILGFIHSSDLSNIHITEVDFYVLSCKLKEKNEHSLYVSHENIKNIPEAAKKIIYSENGVDSLAVIYDLSKIPDDRLHCE